MTFFVVLFAVVFMFGRDSGVTRKVFAADNIF